MKSVTLFLQAFLGYPLLVTIIVIIIGVLLIVFRKHIRAFLEKKFGLKMKRKHEPLSSFCDDVKHVYQFKHHVVIPEQKVLYYSLKKAICRERKAGEILVLDLSAIEQINEHAKEAIRDNLKEAVDKNNCRIEVIFPNTTLPKLFEEIKEYVEHRSSHSVFVKRDKRKK